MKHDLLIPLVLFSYLAMLALTFAFTQKVEGEKTRERHNLAVGNCFHLAGIVLMLAPATVLKPLDTSYLTFPDKIMIGQALGFLAGFGLLALLPWKKYHQGSPVPAFRHNVAQVGLYAGLRTCFLFSYEWFFRGFLLIGVSEWLGTSWSVVINLFLYTILHHYKDKREIVGCLPFGLLLCGFTLWWHSIWPAVIFHLEVAIVNEWPPLLQLIPPKKQVYHENLYNGSNGLHR